MFDWFRAPERKESAARSLIAVHLDGRPVWTPRDYAGFAREGYARNPVAFRCVRMIAEAVASIPLAVRRGGALAGADDPVARLLSAPNPDQPATELIEAFVGFLQVAGNAYLELVEIDGAPRELYALRPDRMKVLAGPLGWPAGYEYEVEGRKARLLRDPVSGRSPILHLRVFHPGHDHYGLSPMEAAGVALDIHAASSAWNKALLDNAARPSGALVYKGRDGLDRLSEEQFERLKAELQEAHQGPRAAGRPMILEGGLEWTPFGLSPADMDFMAAKHAAARDIALAFGVPPMLLGIPGDNTYANYREANLALWRQTVAPLAKKIARALTMWLRPWAGEDLDILCADDDAPALAEERANLWARLEAASFLSLAEKRALAGLPPEPPTPGREAPA